MHSGRPAAALGPGKLSVKRNEIRKKCMKLRGLHTWVADKHRRKESKYGRR
jgi:hypothetical protein